MFAEEKIIITHMKQDQTEGLAMIITELAVRAFGGFAQVDVQGQGKYVFVRPCLQETGFLDLSPIFYNVFNCSPIVILRK